MISWNYAHVKSEKGPLWDQGAKWWRGGGVWEGVWGGCAPPGPPYLSVLVKHKSSPLDFHSTACGESQNLIGKTQSMGNYV